MKHTWLVAFGRNTLFWLALTKVYEWDKAKVELAKVSHRVAHELKCTYDREVNVSLITNVVNADWHDLNHQLSRSQSLCDDLAPSFDGS